MASGVGHRLGAIYREYPRAFWSLVVVTFIDRLGGARETENRFLLLEAHTLAGLRSVVAERMAYYNRVRRHSSIGYRAPASYVATLQPWS
jgi:transposase InsO family protein